MRPLGAPNRGKIVRARVTPSSVRRAARYLHWLCADALLLVELVRRGDVKEEVRAEYLLRLRQLLDERTPLWLHLEIRCDSCKQLLAKVPRRRCDRLGRAAAIDSATPGLVALGCWVYGAGWEARHHCPECSAAARATAEQAYLEAGGYWPASEPFQEER